MKRKRLFFGPVPIDSGMLRDDPSRAGDLLGCRRGRISLGDRRGGDGRRAAEIECLERMRPRLAQARLAVLVGLRVEGHHTAVDGVAARWAGHPAMTDELRDSPHLAAARIDIDCARGQRR
jgi:hypothetical protein